MAAAVVADGALLVGGQRRRGSRGPPRSACRPTRCPRARRWPCRRRPGGACRGGAASSARRCAARARRRRRAGAEPRRPLPSPLRVLGASSPKHIHRRAFYPVAMASASAWPCSSSPSRRRGGARRGHDRPRPQSGADAPGCATRHVLDASALRRHRRRHHVGVLSDLRQLGPKIRARVGASPPAGYTAVATAPARRSRRGRARRPRRDRGSPRLTRRRSRRSGRSGAMTTPRCSGDRLRAAPRSGARPAACDGVDAVELPFGGVIEPDADGDGYGDETQDACPADASPHVAPCDADIAPMFPRGARGRRLAHRARVPVVDPDGRPPRRRRDHARDLAARRGTDRLRTLTLGSGRHDRGATRVGRVWHARSTADRSSARTPSRSRPLRSPAGDRLGLEHVTAPGRDGVHVCRAARPPRRPTQPRPPTRPAPSESPRPTDRAAVRPGRHRARRRHRRIRRQRAGRVPARLGDRRPAAHR